MTGKSKIKSVFTCQNCGTQRPRWEGRCSDCGAWNSFIEENFNPEPKMRGWSLGNEKSYTSLTLDQKIEEIDFKRFDTNIIEMNRVLGGGLVQGSLVLLGGAPGVGKSTLLMQMAGGLARSKIPLLYVSGEESVAQTASRAQRLGVRTSFVEVASESNLLKILEMAKAKKPSVLIVDSIQTIFHPNLDSAPGTVSQVRDCAGHLMGLAKNEGISVVLIGHITKDGSLAGPKVLEHMVDCVLSFDGDMNQNFRLLRALKNRFGPAQELGVFQMDTQGLKEVLNPSELFLEERSHSLIGSAVFASMEGSRPLLCEVQALTVETPMAMPRRTALGIESNRLQMLTAVIDRHLEMNLIHRDVFVNVVGGLKLFEPSSDLAVAATLISTEFRKQIDPKAVFFGEIGLTGEVRAVSFADQRVKEASKLGFHQFILPHSNKKHLAELQLPKENHIYWMSSINDLSKWINGNG